MPSLVDRPIRFYYQGVCIHPRNPQSVANSVPVCMDLRVVREFRSSEFMSLNHEDTEAQSKPHKRIGRI